MSLEAQEIQAGPSEPKAAQGPRSRTLQARRKSQASPRQTEFVNCQSKLTGGTVEVPVVPATHGSYTVTVYTILHNNYYVSVFSSYQRPAP